MRIAICDDDQNQIYLTAKYVRDWAQKRGVPVDLITYSSAAKLLLHWSEGRNFDIAFLDIKMNCMTGLELAREIRKRDNEMIIVFITGIIDYVLQGYDVQALHYLLKPVKEADCFTCLDRAQEIIMLRSEKTFVIPLELQSLRLFYHEIYTFESVSHYIEVKSTKDSFSFKKNMKELEKELPAEAFFRCHRSFIVNMQYVNTVKKNEVVLDNGIRIPVSKNQWKTLSEAFIKYYAKGVKL